MMSSERDCSCFNSSPSTSWSTCSLACAWGRGGGWGMAGEADAVATMQRVSWEQRSTYVHEMKELHPHHTTSISLHLRHTPAMNTNTHRSISSQPPPPHPPPAAQCVGTSVCQSSCDACLLAAFDPSVPTPSWSQQFPSRAYLGPWLSQPAHYT